MNKWVAGLKQTQAARKKIMEISLLVMEKSWKSHGIWILNFCGNPVTCTTINVLSKNKKKNHNFYSREIFQYIT